MKAMLLLIIMLKWKAVFLLDAQNTTEAINIQNTMHPQTTTGKKDFQNTTGKKDIQSTTEEMVIQNITTTTHTPTTTGRKDFHNTTVKKDIQSTTKTIDIQNTTSRIHIQNTTGQMDLQNVSGEMDNSKPNIPDKREVLAPLVKILRGSCGYKPFVIQRKGIAGTVYWHSIPPFVDFPWPVVRYDLYTRQNPERPQRIRAGCLDISFLNVSQPLKIIVHTWIQSSTSEEILYIKNEYLKYMDVNVVIVDWSLTAKEVFYPLVVIQTKDIGRIVAKFIRELIGFGVSNENIHLIGFGIGAHVSGFAGEQFPKKLKRITAVDPAYCGYPADQPLKAFGGAGRLNVTHAEFVDCIMTNQGNIIVHSSCHAKFYVNPGSLGLQPGCKNELAEDCSHRRALTYFAESIGLSDFPSLRWVENATETVLMGDPLPLSTRGTYRTATNLEFPYGKKKE